MQNAHERIKSARIQRGFSQKQMAEMLKISQPAYSQIETGKYPNMRISTLVEICEILDTSTDYILGIISKNPFDAFERFYMSIVDTIINAENNELISETAATSILRKIDNLKTDFDNTI